ncbi:TetR/AcrR family transcriptional regulator [Clostridium sp. KNHs205]|uniref:TetR/AcrR family transcriptional regulator n=1 Tax=Clostridium sp. KNHs205 TaxID=1449050 RepID=UPI00051C1D00|nr:TetR/AcrR family transcriptional regulator [Clostridium sp. KNHs205]
MRELKSIEEKILDRALFLIGKNHSCDIPVRAIAKEAGVNVSAINYYFRTKEEMLKQAKELYIENVHSILSILEKEEYNEEEKLIYATNEIMEYIIRYPGITVILNESSKLEDETSKKILRTSKNMTNRVQQLLDYLINQDELRCQYKRMIFWASINYPIENNEFTDVDKKIIEDRDSRIAYIRYLIEFLRESPKS